ncbi:MAG: CsiV family protein [Gammaproteobacteria bacterium]|nr:CsiV family protein [Gammaproteobacteria bacterium]
MKRHRYWLGALAALAALSAGAKVDDPNDLIRGRWYATEVIIFERTDPAGPEPEELVWERGRTWPAGVRAFAEPEPWRIASLDPLTRACLEFPRLDVAPALGPETALVDGEAVEPPPGVEAGAVPAVDGKAPGFDPEAPEIQPLEADLDAMPLDGLAPLESIATIPPPPIDPRLSPHPLLNLLGAAARQQEAQRRDSYRWLPTQTHVLKTEARRLRNAEGLDIIWHGRWMQPVPSRSAGEPLMLASQAAPSRGQLSGTLQVTLGRYLHFDARLWLEQPTHSPAAAAPYMQLRQARTMRSGELHYLDHPRMGVLVRIDPLPPSPALAQALRAWEASAGG